MPGSFIASDLAAMMDTAVFADTVTRADASTFVGIFDAAYLDPLGVAGVEPVLLVQDTVSLTRGETLTVRGTAYKVRAIEPDGTGAVLARLERQ